MIIKEIILHKFTERLMTDENKIIVFLEDIKTMDVQKLLAE